MRKVLIVATVIAVFVSFTGAAFAEIGFEFRVPFQVVGKKDMKDVSGQATLLQFDLDGGTKVGILNEHIDYTDKLLAASFSYDITAIRISKTIVEPVTVGLDMGGLQCGNATKNIADIFGGVKLLASKGKITSYFNVELLYRFAKFTPNANGVTDLSGAMLNFGAGLNF